MPAEGVGGESDLREPGNEPPASPLPRRVAGQSGIAYPAGDPARPPGVIRRPGYPVGRPGDRRPGRQKCRTRRGTTGRANAVAGLRRGEYHTEVQPSVRHLTTWCPLPRDCARTAGAHPHGDHPTLE